MLTSTDQLGNTIQLTSYPQRIISLVPSQTEFLFDIGLDEEIVGITRFCIHPEAKVGVKEKIGGTKKFNIEKIKSLQPDLIIGNKEENYEEGIGELRKHFPVWMSEIYTLEDVLAMMGEVSALVNRKEEGTRLINEIKTRFQAIQSNKPVEQLSVAYFIWRKPYMVAANGTFIHHLLELCGLRNAFSTVNRYPEINPDELAVLKPDFIFLSSEPYSFSEKHFDEFQAFSPTSKVLVVDGEMFSWYGSRLLKTPEYFTKLWQKLGSTI